MGEIQRIREQLDRSFRGPAWHGPSVHEVLEGVTAAQATARPLGHAHSIGEIVLHMATWKSVVARRVSGEVVGNIPDDEDWPKAGGGESEWTAAKGRLESAHASLVAALGRLSDEQLDQPPYKDASTRYVQLHGVIQHDLYHAGQIAVLKKG
jgi:uncharacterized damage-inducible protein DinB